MTYVLDWEGIKNRLELRTSEIIPWDDYDGFNLGLSQRLHTAISEELGLKVTEGHSTMANIKPGDKKIGEFLRNVLQVTNVSQNEFRACKYVLLALRLASMGASGHGWPQLNRSLQEDTELDFDSLAFAIRTLQNCK